MKWRVILKQQTSSADSLRKPENCTLFTLLLEQEHSRENRTCLHVRSTGSTTTIIKIFLKVIAHNLLTKYIYHAITSGRK